MCVQDVHCSNGLERPRTASLGAVRKLLHVAGSDDSGQTWGLCDVG